MPGACQSPTELPQSPPLTGAVKLPVVFRTCTLDTDLAEYHDSYVRGLEEQYV